MATVWSYVTLNIILYFVYSYWGIFVLKCTQRTFVTGKQVTV